MTFALTVVQEWTVIQMAKYILKQEAIFVLVNEAKIHNNPLKRAYARAAALIEQIKAEDVQLLSVVAEHIKKRLYETAFNTDEPIASHAIEDMAERIDFWINELKEGGDGGEP